MMVGQLGWEKIDPMRALKHLVAMQCTIASLIIHSNPDLTSLIIAIFCHNVYIRGFLLPFDLSFLLHLRDE